MSMRLLRLLTGIGTIALVAACASPNTGGQGAASGDGKGQSNTLAGLPFSNVSLELLSYGQSNRVFAFPRKSLRPKALSPAGTSPATSYYSVFQFDIGSSSTAILGFDVYRSTDDATFTKIGTENYGMPATPQDLSQSSFLYYDYDATLKLGTTYYYCVQAFDSSGNYSAQSPVASAEFMSPFTLGLSSPASGATGVGASPTFTFALSSSAPSLWNSSVSDYFYFSLFIQDTIGNPVYYGEFRYRFSTGQWQAPSTYYSDGTADWNLSPTTVTGISYSSGTISVALGAVSGYDNSYVTSTYGSLAQLLLAGHSYEWDVFGDWEGNSVDSLGASDAMDSAYFVRSTGSFSASGDSVSYANTYANGEGSLNGSFTFSY